MERCVLFSRGTELTGEETGLNTQFAVRRESSGSKMLEAGRQLGLRVASEVFADRAYQADGSLVPRSKPGAVIHDTDEAIARTIRMVKEGKVTAITGEEVPLDAHSICVHGDNPQAVEFVKCIRARLIAEGVSIVPLGEIV